MWTFLKSGIENNILNVFRELIDCENVVLAGAFTPLVGN